MKALLLAPVLALPFALPAATPEPFGAPSLFRVTGTSVTCEEREETRTLRVVYELDVIDPACGWVCAEVGRLPLDGPAKSVLHVDELAVDGIVEHEDGAWRFGMWHTGQKRLPGELARAKSVRLELEFETRRDAPLAALALDAPRPLWRKDDVEPALGSLDVRVEREGAQGLTALTASYAAARPGSELVLRCGDDGANVLLGGRVGDAR